jgi:hypothetical protein
MSLGRPTFFGYFCGDKLLKPQLCPLAFYLSPFHSRLIYVKQKLDFNFFSRPRTRETNTEILKTCF